MAYTIEEKPVLTVDETAKILSISRNSAYQGVLRGEIPHIRIGKRILIPRRALDRMLEGAGPTGNGSDIGGGKQQ